ncbi:Protein cereblon [Nymphon striatum]|nr:Protein cereblon [Nymphon striatum]
MGVIVVFCTGRPRKKLGSHFFTTLWSLQHSRQVLTVVILPTLAPRMSAIDYLGNDLEELSGRTVFEEYECVELPLLSYSGVVLIPGQVIPLKISNPPTIVMLKDVISKNRTIGIVVKVVNSNSRSYSLASVGTTAEIRSYKEDNTVLLIKAEGQQRFCLKGDPQRRGDRSWICKVQILPEIIPTDPGNLINPNSFQRFQLSTPQSETICTRRKYIFSIEQESQQFLLDEILLKRIKQELLGWTNSVNIKSMPEDPMRFSYWVASNLPLDDSLKVMLLTRDSLVQRLRCEMSILENYRMLYCKECHSPTTRKEDLFSLSLVGPQGTYVNPGGYVHETITVFRVENVESVTRPSNEHSWFPGFVGWLRGVKVARLSIYTYCDLISTMIGANHASSEVSLFCHREV